MSITGDNAATWPLGSTLVLKYKCVFPQVSTAAADPAQQYHPGMITGKAFILHTPERVQLMRHLTNGRHIVCHHASGTTFISSSEHFSPFKA